jgi:hypothetical protein
MLNNVSSFINVRLAGYASCWRTEGKEEGHRWEGTLQRSSGHA